MADKDFADVDYARLTTGDRNRFKRKLQQTRLTQSIRALAGETVQFNGTILDYGAGNGELCKHLAQQYPHSNICCYEPSDKLRRQAVKNLAAFDFITVMGTLQTLPPLRFDYIFCLEVFEHLPEAETLQALNNIRQLVKPDGCVIIGIPNEIYLAALLKGTFRMVRRYGEPDAIVPNVLKAAAGFPPRQRTVVSFDGLPYILRHIGFDHRKFMPQLAQVLDIEYIYGSPFPLLPLLFNFEIYCICRAEQAESGKLSADL